MSSISCGVAERCHSAQKPYSGKWASHGTKPFTLCCGGRRVQGVNRYGVDTECRSSLSHGTRLGLTAGLKRGGDGYCGYVTVFLIVQVIANHHAGVQSQMELHSVSAARQEVPRSRYANLIKSSWILIDIIACHPQIHFITASSRSDVQLLSAELKKEFDRLSKLQLIVPDLGEMQGQDLRIWEKDQSSPRTRHREHRYDPTIDAWTVGNGDEGVFQGYALFREFALLQAAALAAS